MTKPSDQNVNNTRVVRNLLFTVVAMFGFGFALVPLYNVFCDITGLNGKTDGSAYDAADVVIDTSRTVKVEFVANLNSNMPWEFVPVTSSMAVHPGESHKVEYIARNRTDRDIIGQAVPSVTPGTAANYFKKTECFCFTEQVLKAGEEKKMPVIFIVDPEVGSDVGEITLSYTFFIKPGSEEVDGDAANPPLAAITN